MCSFNLIKLFNIKLFDPNKHILKNNYCNIDVHKIFIDDSIGNIGQFFLENNREWWTILI
jgi:hypothetical protein